ncbi:MAG: methyltransferase domain-containing protein [Planctomycetota bacterium]|nr:MAG: methyltransferase domain-containing protein [Planctomycetota bacterium]
MAQQAPTRRPRRLRRPRKQRGGNPLFKILENDLISRVSYEQYRDRVRNVYGGRQGAFLATASMLSLHIPLGERLLRERKFDLRGVRDILDVGSGAGQIAGHLLKYADPEARITCCDLSPEMLARARNRLKSSVPRYVSADLSHLPFADESFDCVTCGYVLEHLPDARPGLAEMARVMKPGGRLLLLTTEDNFSGAWTSRLWLCRTYNREQLRQTTSDLGLTWKNELWFTRMHKLLRAGGICVEIEKR